jgi:hypothetical protein
MEYGVLIDRHLELIRIDPEADIYISRKALKHFVESRKAEMRGGYSEEEVFNRLYFAIENIISTYEIYDELKIQESGRLVYEKYFANTRNSSLRIVIERIENRSEICSIHSRKRKIPP